MLRFTRVGSWVGLTSLDEYFHGRPESMEIFAILAERINALGEVEMTG